MVIEPFISVPFGENMVGVLPSTLNPMSGRMSSSKMRILAMVSWLPGNNGCERGSHELEILLTIRVEVCHSPAITDICEGRIGTSGVERKLPTTSIVDNVGTSVICEDFKPRHQKAMRHTSEKDTGQAGMKIFEAIDHFYEILTLRLNEGVYPNLLNHRDFLKWAVL